MANDENLKHGEATQFRSGEQAAAAGSKGGIASGEARRRKRTLREIAEMLADKTIDVPMPNGSTENMSYEVAMIHGQYQRAITKGDTKAAKFLATLLGEFVEKHEVEAKGDVVLLPAEVIDSIKGNAK